MDPSHVKRLKDENQKGLQLCKEKILKWEKFKSDYEALKQRLGTLPDHLSYDITVPFGSNAFTKGKLVHTNEIMVLLGDNWFVEVSAKQAAAIASRRITHCTSMLEDMYKEKQQFENWLNYISEVSGNEDLVEIVEEYDEERERSWKEQHARNVKAYRQQLSSENKSEGTDGANNSEEDIFDQLDMLQLNETELDIKEMESDRSTVECSDDGSHSEEQPVKPTLKLNINCNNSRKASESETGDDVEDISKKDVNANVQESSSPGNGKHVRWQDLSKQSINRITFKHSKMKKQQNSPNSKHKFHDSSEDENHPLIQSPSDIYKYFGNCFQSSPPKSILKVKSPSPATEMNGPIFPTKESASKESSPETDESMNSPFTGVVRERSDPINIVDSKSSRPVSHFKSSRKNRKR